MSLRMRQTLRLTGYVCNAFSLRISLTGMVKLMLHVLWFLIRYPISKL